MGIRGGASTLFFPLWHYEFEDLIVLKNNKGVDDARARKVDYCFQFNGFLYQRLLENGVISFFSPHEVPGLYDAFCQDQEEFARLYVKYEKDPKIRKRQLSAREAFTIFSTERFETGRIYLQNIDHSNTHSPFITSKAPIEQSNLCMEIDLPSKPFTDVNTGNDGLISLCTLGAINWGNFNEPHEMEEACELVVRTLDAILDYQDYPVIHAERATKLYRPLGVGINNLAYFLAKRGLKYDRDALETVNEWAEAWSYYLIKASVQLAKENGRCDGYDDLKYSQGILPIDTYKEAVDEIVSNEFKMPWDELREEIKLYGIRNATVMALMPSECQKWSNKLNTVTHGEVDFHELCDIYGIDYKEVEKFGVPQSFELDKPFIINTRNGQKEVSKLYYNGDVETYDITFEDGKTYSFSGNHTLLVELQDGKHEWVRVDSLDETMNVISINVQ